MSYLETQCSQIMSATQIGYSIHIIHLFPPTLCYFIIDRKENKSVYAV